MSIWQTIKGWFVEPPHPWIGKVVTTGAHYNSGHYTIVGKVVEAQGDYLTVETIGSYGLVKMNCHVGDIIEVHQS